MEYYLDKDTSKQYPITECTNATDLGVIDVRSLAFRSLRQGSALSTSRSSHLR